MDRIIGKTPVHIADIDDAQIIMDFSDGSSCIWHHIQDCCEDVSIEDINGDWNDLIGRPLIVAEERVGEDEDEDEVGTWTFYTFRSVGGSVDVRWLGTSNGYYSESVYFTFTEPQ